MHFLSFPFIDIVFSRYTIWVAAKVLVSAIQGVTPAYAVGDQLIGIVADLVALAVISSLAVVLSSALGISPASAFSPA